MNTTMYTRPSGWNSHGTAKRLGAGANSHRKPTEVQDDTIHDDYVGPDPE